MKPKRIASNTQELNLVQDTIGEAFSQISPLVYTMSLLKDIELVAGSNFIPHKLERALQGWIVVKRNTGAVIFDEQANNKYPQTSLRLNSTGLVTVTLLVF
jgi:hypothetical protein